MTDKLSDSFDVTAASFCDEVVKRAKALGLRVFVVAVNDATDDGASATLSPKENSNDAISHARKAHVEWELRNGINPNHSRHD